MNEVRLDQVEINGVTYVRADSVPQVPGEIAIIIADRGFVYVGKMEVTADYTILRNAQNIRNWGTTKGIGQLVSGPTKDTKLDPVGTVRIPNRAVISIVDVDQAKWKLL